MYRGTFNGFQQYTYVHGGLHPCNDELAVLRYFAFQMRNRTRAVPNPRDFCCTSPSLEEDGWTHVIISALTPFVLSFAVLYVLNSVSSRFSSRKWHQRVHRTGIPLQKVIIDTKRSYGVPQQCDRHNNSMTIINTPLERTSEEWRQIHSRQKSILRKKRAR